VQPRQDFVELVDIYIRDSQKKLAPYFVEASSQLWRNPLTSPSGPDDLEPSVLRMAFPRQKAARFEPVHKACDLSFVSAHELGELSSVRLSLFDATQKHSRFLCSHPEGIETVVKDRLQPDAHPEEPGNG
jgi:hypothetical protein